MAKTTGSALQRPAGESPLKLLTWVAGTIKFLKPRILKMKIAVSFRSFLVVLGVLHAMSGLAAAAPVRGIIKLPNDHANTDSLKFPGYWLIPNEILDVLPPLVDPRLSMVVVVEGPGLASSRIVDSLLIIEDSRFFPPVLPVRINTTVRFTNKDAMLHLLEPAGGSFLTPKRLGPGASTEHTFKEKGVFRLRCGELPHLTATIFVTDSPLFALPDAKGTFSFPNIPDGKYTLRIWYGNEWIHSQHLQVTGKTTLEVKLEKPLLKD
jgi:hypothetical protein